MNSASHNKADNPSFFELVYQVVRLIPKGRVTTYGAIAAYLGSKQSSRAVGYALNGAHFIKPKVPAQRVVNRNGMLSGKAHFETKRQWRVACITTMSNHEMWLETKSAGPVVTGLPRTSKSMSHIRRSCMAHT